MLSWFYWSNNFFSSHKFPTCYISWQLQLPSNLSVSLLWSMKKLESKPILPCMLLSLYTMICLVSCLRPWFLIGLPLNWKNYLIIHLPSEKGSETKMTKNLDFLLIELSIYLSLFFLSIYLSFWKWKEQELTF